MSAPMSIRLDQKTRRTIVRLARDRRESQSAVIRDAIAALLERTPAAGRPYEAWRGVIGITRSKAGNLSEHTGARFRALLEARTRRGR